MLFVPLGNSVPSTTFVMPRYGGRKRELPILSSPGSPIYHDRGSPIRQDFSKLRKQRDLSFLPTSFGPSINGGSTGGGINLAWLPTSCRLTDSARLSQPPEVARSYNSTRFWLDGMRTQPVPKKLKLGPNRPHRAILSGGTPPISTL